MIHKQDLPTAYVYLNCGPSIHPGDTRGIRSRAMQGCVLRIAADIFALGAPMRAGRAVCWAVPCGGLVWA